MGTQRDYLDKTGALYELVKLKNYMDSTLATKSALTSLSNSESALNSTQNSHLGSLSTENSLQNSEIASMSVSLSEHASEIASLAVAQSEAGGNVGARLDSLSTENANQESEISSMSLSLSEIAENIASLSTAQSEVDGSQNASISSLTTENSTQNISLSSLTTENSQQTSEINSLSIATSELSSATEYLTSEVATKQNVLTPGTRITISGSTISADSEIDDTVTNSSNTWSSSKIQAALTALNSLKLAVVSTLPTQDISLTTIYLLPKASAQTNNVFDEYVYIENEGFVEQNAVGLKEVSNFPEIGETGVIYYANNTEKAYVWDSATSSYVDTGYSVSVVGSLPATGVANTLYIANSKYYLWINNSGWEKIGDTEIDLSGYVLDSDLVPITNAEIDTMFEIFE